MIKFFRKIRQKLLSENKFSKYLIYAFGEIVLVVIGILIALQINNLNDEFKEKKTLISELRNAQIYLQREIEKEENDLQNLLAWIDTLQQGIRIIEEVDFPSLMDDKYLKSSRTHMMKVGLRTNNTSTMDNLSVSLTKSKKESRHDLFNSINLLVDLIQQGTRLEESFFDDMLYLNSSVNKAAWRRNSNRELYYDFNLIKNDYDLHYLFLQSITYKRTSAGWTRSIIEKYKLLQKQIEDLLRELD